MISVGEGLAPPEQIRITPRHPQRFSVGADVPIGPSNDRQIRAGEDTRPYTAHPNLPFGGGKFRTPLGTPSGGAGSPKG